MHTEMQPFQEMLPAMQQLLQCHAQHSHHQQHGELSSQTTVRLPSLSSALSAADDGGNYPLSTSANTNTNASTSSSSSFSSSSSSVSGGGYNLHTMSSAAMSQIPLQIDHDSSTMATSSSSSNDIVSSSSSGSNSELFPVGAMDVNNQQVSCLFSCPLLVYFSSALAFFSLQSNTTTTITITIIITITMTATTPQHSSIYARTTRGSYACTK